MRKIAVFLILLIGFSSCKSSKNSTVRKEVIDRRTDRTVKSKSSKNNIELARNIDSKNNETVSSSISFDIINYAKQFEGIRYRYGGTTKEGMDCSGLIFESFRAYDIYLPRISRDMAKQGEKVSLKKTQRGDLLFFKTRNRRNNINHVGLVVEIEDNAIKFIHATTSNGVIISSLNESYWKDAFKEVRRIL